MFTKKITHSNSFTTFWHSSLFKKELSLFILLILSCISLGGQSCLEEQYFTVCPGECIVIGCGEIDLNDYCVSWASFPPTDVFEDVSSPQFEVCPLEDMSYVLNGIDDEGNLAYTFYYNVEVKNSEVIIYPRKPIICEGISTVILGLEGDYVTYAWSNGNSSPEIIASEAGSYSVTVVDDFGCEKIGEVNVSDVSNDRSLILDFFEGMDFAVLPIIESVPAFQVDSDPAEVNSSKLNLCNIVSYHAIENTDYTLKEEYLLFAEDVPEVNMVDLLSTDCENFHAENLIITDNNFVCEKGLFNDLIETYNNNQGLNIWVHIYRDGEMAYLVLGHNDGVKRKLRGMPELRGFVEDLPDVILDNGGCSTPDNVWRELDFRTFDDLAQNYGSIRYTNFASYVQRLGRIFEDAAQKHLYHRNRDTYIYPDGRFYLRNPPNNGTGSRIPDYLQDVNSYDYIINPADPSSFEIRHIDWWPWSDGISTWIPTNIIAANLRPAFIGDAKVVSTQLSNGVVPNSQQAQDYVSYLNNVKQVYRYTSLTKYYLGKGTRSIRNPTETHDAYLEYATLEDMIISDELVQNAQSNNVRLIQLVAEYQICPEGVRIRLDFAGEKTLYPDDPLIRAVTNDRTFTILGDEVQITDNAVFLDWTRL